MKLDIEYLNGGEVKVRKTSAQMRECVSLNIPKQVLYMLQFADLESSYMLNVINFETTCRSCFLRSMYTRSMYTRSMYTTSMYTVVQFIVFTTQVHMIYALKEPFLFILKARRVP